MWVSQSPIGSGVGGMTFASTLGDVVQASGPNTLVFNDAGQFSSFVIVRPAAPLLPVGDLSTLAPFGVGAASASGDSFDTYLSNVSLSLDSSGGGSDFSED